MDVANTIMRWGSKKLHKTAFLVLITNDLLSILNYVQLLHYLVKQSLQPINMSLPFHIDRNELLIQLNYSMQHHEIRPSSDINVNIVVPS